MVEPTARRSPEVGAGRRGRGAGGPAPLRGRLGGAPWAAEIVWNVSLLERLLPDDTALREQLRAWVQAGDLAARPWEYCVAASLTGEVRVPTPLALLDTALAERWRALKAAGASPQALGKQRKSLARQAWQAYTQETARWQPRRREEERAAQVGVQARLVVVEGAGAYRFAQRLWQQYLAACYAVTLEPETVLAAVWGLAEGAELLGWVGVLAWESGARTWVAQLAAAWQALVAGSPAGSGWLLGGAEAVGTWLRWTPLGDLPLGQQLRAEAEAGLWAVWARLSQVGPLPGVSAVRLAQAWRALAPWTPETARRLGAGLSQGAEWGAEPWYTLALSLIHI